jgi:hypothetical protein
MQDALDDPTCTCPGCEIVVDRINNPFIQDNIVFGGVGGYTVSSFNSATIQGTGHTVTAPLGVTFTGLNFDGFGAAGATLITAPFARNVVFTQCSFFGTASAIDADGYLPALPLQPTTLDISDCTFSELTHKAVRGVDFGCITFSANTLTNVGQEDDATEFSLVPSSLCRIHVLSTIISNAPGVGNAALNRTAIYVRDIDTTLPTHNMFDPLGGFAVRDNTVVNFPVALRISGVPDSVILNNLPAGQTVTLNDVRKPLRELAKQVHPPPPQHTHTLSSTHTHNARQRRHTPAASTAQRVRVRVYRGRIGRGSGRARGAPGSHLCIPRGVRERRPPLRLLGARGGV